MQYDSGDSKVMITSVVVADGLAPGWASENIYHCWWHSLCGLLSGAAGVVGWWLLMLGVHLITRGPMGLFHTVQSINHWWKLASRYQPMRKKIVTVSSRWAVSSPWAHCDHSGHGSGPNDHGSVVGEVTAQSRRGHSSVTARSQLSHGKVTAQSQHPQYDHCSVTARSQLNHGPGHGSVTAGCDHFGHRELTVSSLWAHGEQSRWPFFFLMGVSN